MRPSLFLMILAFGALLLEGDELTLMTEHYPPYNYEENGTIKGISSDVVQEIIRRTGTKSSAIELLPWSRAYQTIQIKPSCALFSMAKTDAREKLFKWVGPIAQDQVYFFKKAGSPTKIASLDDARNVQAIGVVKNTSGHLQLVTLGFTNLDIIPDATLNVRKLMLDRIQLTPSVEVVIRHRAKRDGIDPAMLENTGVSYDQQSLFIAFSRDVPDSLIQQWQKALDAIISDGTHQRIYEHYLR